MQGRRRGDARAGSRALAGVRTIRVFVSSTFKDGHAERDAINHSAVPRLRLALAGRGLFLNVVDLRWGITEGAAESGDVVCLLEVTEWGYGWAQPQGGPEDPLLAASLRAAERDFPFVKAYPHASLTELEAASGSGGAPASSFYSAAPAFKNRWRSGTTRAAARTWLEEARLSHEAFASARRRVYVQVQGAFAPLDAHAAARTPPRHRPLGDGRERAGRCPRDALILHFVGGSARSARLFNLVQPPPPPPPPPRVLHEMVSDTPSPEAANDLANLYEDLGEYGRATRLYGEALQSIPSGPPLGIVAHNNMIFSGSEDNTETLTPVKSLTGHKTVFSLAANGRNLFSGSRDQSIKVWDLATLEMRKTLHSPHLDGVNAFALTSTSLFSGSRDKSIKQWDLNGFQATRSRMAAHAEGVV
eukprot:tig00021070_g17843.t1